MVYGYCTCYAFKYIKGEDPPLGVCGLIDPYGQPDHIGWTDSLIRKSCDMVSGRVDRQNEDTTALDSCAFAHQEFGIIRNCRVILS